MDLIEAKRSELIDLCDRYGVRRLALFGSVLREDFDPEQSDLDFSVEFSPMAPEEHAAAYFGLLEDLEELFGRRVELVEIGAVRATPIYAGRSRNGNKPWLDAAVAANLKGSGYEA
jgi:predicted nucleotidyltransferase